MSKTTRSSASATTLALSEKRAKEMADRLGAFLAAGGTPLGRRNLLEAVAAMLGGTDWNTMKAMLAAAPAVPGDASLTLGVVADEEGDIIAILSDRPGLRIDAVRLAPGEWQDATRALPAPARGRISAGHCAELRARVVAADGAAARRLPFNERLRDALEDIFEARATDSEWSDYDGFEADGVSISIFHATDDPAQIEIRPFARHGVEIVDTTRTEGFDGGRFRVENQYKVIETGAPLPAAIRSLLTARFLDGLTEDEEDILDALEAERQTLL